MPSLGLSRKLVMEHKNRKKRQFLLSTKIFIAIFIACLTLYLHINQNNQLTAIQLAIPQLEKEVKKLQKDNERLHYDIERFESPIHLMELLRKPDFSYLKFPHQDDIIILPRPKDPTEPNG